MKAFKNPDLDLEGNQEPTKALELQVTDLLPLPPKSFLQINLSPEGYSVKHNCVFTSQLPIESCRSKQVHTKSSPVGKGKDGAQF